MTGSSVSFSTVTVNVTSSPVSSTDGLSAVLVTTYLGDHVGEQHVCVVVRRGARAFLADAGNRRVVDVLVAGLARDERRDRAARRITGHVASTTFSRSKQSVSITPVRVSTGKKLPKTLSESSVIVTGSPLTKLSLVTVNV